MGFSNDSFLLLPAIVFYFLYEITKELLCLAFIDSYVYLPGLKRLVMEVLKLQTMLCQSRQQAGEIHTLFCLNLTR